MSHRPDKYTPRSIFITGAAGFIASHVTKRLIKNYPDYKIVALDKLDYCSSLKNLLPARSSPNFKFVKGDIASADLVNRLLAAEGIDTIMHFAAQTHVDTHLATLLSSQTTTSMGLMSSLRPARSPARSTASSKLAPMRSMARPTTCMLMWATMRPRSSSPPTPTRRPKPGPRRLSWPAHDHNARKQCVWSKPIPRKIDPKVHPTGHEGAAATYPW